MALIVVAEDDAGTRTLIATVLRKDGHDVLAVDDGEQALAIIRSRKPALVISDVQMPRMDGFQMLAQLRMETTVAATPVILLTSLQERAHMRIGMTSGADDYITKPFRPGELREAVQAQLNKRQVQATLRHIAVDEAVKYALREQAMELTKLYERRLAKELSDRWPSGDGSEHDEVIPRASVLFVDLADYAELAQRLSPEELGDVVKRFYANAGDTANLFGAYFMQFVGEGLLAIYADQADKPTAPHGLRAVRSAAALADAARRVGQHMRSTWPGRELPDFRICIALNSGPVSLAKLLDPLLVGAQGQTLPVGQAVSESMLLQKQAEQLGWNIIASVELIRGVTGAVRTGARSLVNLRGRTEPMDVVEVLGLAL